MNLINISEEEVKTRLEFDNPWWASRSYIDSKINNYPKRMYFNTFYKLVINRSINRALILMGPRRVGKTVMVQHSILSLLEGGVDNNKIVYLSLETPLYSGLSLEKIVKLFRGLFDHSRAEHLYIFFDEIQYLKNWEVHLKSLVDSYPDYKFIATGSAAAALRMKSKESGAGRFTDYLLPPLTFAEYLKFLQKEKDLIQSEFELETLNHKATDINRLNNEFINYLNYGGYPEAVFSREIQEDSSRYIKSDIIDKVLLRDLPSLYGINDIQELNRLFTTLAYNTGNEVSLENLSKVSGVAKNTLKRYLEYLEAAFLIKIIHKIDQNAKHFKRVTTFKVYLTNPSMRAALFGNVSKDSEAMGPLTETAIFSQWLHSSHIDKIYYARWNKGEVDMVYLDSDEGQHNWIVEVKWSDRVVEDQHLRTNSIRFAKENEFQHGVLITTKTKYGEIVDRGINIMFRPSSEYAYTVGMNLLDSKV